MHAHKSPRDSWVRFLAFFLLPALVIYVCNTFFIATDAATALMLDEMRARNDIDLAFVGSSVVLNDVNPALITEKTGYQAFDLALPNMGQESMYAAVKLMYKTNRPKHVVLLLDPDTLLRYGEDFAPQPRLAPRIYNPIDRFAYYLDVASADKQFINRLLIFHSLPLESLADLEKTLTIRRNPERYRQQITLNDPSTVYEGAGYLRVSTAMSRNAHFERLAWMQQDFVCGDTLPPRLQRCLRRLAKLCEKNGSQLLVTLAPLHTVFKLANPSDRTIYARVTDFCAANGIPCMNLALARPSALPALDDHLYDLIHLNATGSDLFSAYLADLLNRFWAGESVGEDFYASWDEFDHAFDAVSNAYLLPP